MRLSIVKDALGLCGIQLLHFLEIAGDFIILENSNENLKNLCDYHKNSGYYCCSLSSWDQCNKVEITCNEIENAGSLIKISRNNIISFESFRGRVECTVRLVEAHYCTDYIADYFDNISELGNGFSHRKCFIEESFWETPASFFNILAKLHQKFRYIFDHIFGELYSQLSYCDHDILPWHGPSFEDGEKHNEAKACCSEGFSKEPNWIFCEGPALSEESSLRPLRKIASE